MVDVGVLMGVVMFDYVLLLEDLCLYFFIFYEFCVDVFVFEDIDKVDFV